MGKKVSSLGYLKIFERVQLFEPVPDVKLQGQPVLSEMTISVLSEIGQQLFVSRLPERRLDIMQKFFTGIFSTLQRKDGREFLDTVQPQWKVAIVNYH